MTRKLATPPKALGHRWYLAEWAQSQGKIQAHAQRDLGWPKSTTSALWNNNQRYNQDLIDEAARWLDILPYELLMPPAEALAIRRIKKTAAEIAEFVSGPNFHENPVSQPSGRIKA